MSGARTADTPADITGEKRDTDGLRWTARDALGSKWWSGRGSNPRPSHCERDALPTELPPHMFAGSLNGRLAEVPKERAILAPVPDLANPIN
jgi:hypothetical protein